MQTDCRTCLLPHSLTNSTTKIGDGFLSTENSVVTQTLPKTFNILALPREKKYRTGLKWRIFVRLGLIQEFRQRQSRNAHSVRVTLRRYMVKWWCLPGHRTLFQDTSLSYFGRRGKCTPQDFDDFNNNYKPVLLVLIVDISHVIDEYFTRSCLRLRRSQFRHLDYWPQRLMI